jgi:hypothetical protein
LSSSKVGSHRDSIVEPIIPREGESVSWGEKPSGIGIEGSYAPMKRSEREEGCQQEKTEITDMRGDMLYVTKMSTQVANATIRKRDHFSDNSMHLIC